MAEGKRPITASLIANLRAATPQGFPIVRALLNQASRGLVAISVPPLCPLQFLASHRDPGAVLLLPFVVSCINLAVPRFYSAFRLVERYEMPRHEVTALLVRYVCLSLPVPTLDFHRQKRAGSEKEFRSPSMSTVDGREGVACVDHAGMQAERAATLSNMAGGHSRGQAESWRASLACKCSSLEVMQWDLLSLLLRVHLPGVAKWPHSSTGGQECPCYCVPRRKHGRTAQQVMVVGVSSVI